MSEQPPPARPVRSWAKVTLADGTVHEVGIDQRDFVAYDLEYRRNGWPPAQEAPLLVSSYVAARALIRQGDHDGRTAKWLVEEGIALVDQEEDEDIRPTEAGLGSGSLSSSP